MCMCMYLGVYLYAQCVLCMYVHIHTCVCFMFECVMFKLAQACKDGPMCVCTCKGGPLCVLVKMTPCVCGCACKDCLYVCVCL